MKIITTCMLLCLSTIVFGQQKVTQDQYAAELEKLSNQFYGFFVPHLKELYSMPQTNFVKKIDSLKAPFYQLIDRYKKDLGQAFAEIQQTDDDFSIDKFIVYYPYVHQEYTKSVVSLSRGAAERLKKHRLQFNRPDYLKLAGYNDYVDAVIHYDWVAALKSGKFATSDNKKLDGVFSMLPGYFTNKKCLDYCQYYYLKYHIENIGIKDVEKVYHVFTASCSDTSYTNKITALYNADLQGRRGHIIKTYKTVDGFSLDIHLFLPDSNKFKSTNKPIIVYFHGGSWTEGKPDWFFGTCKYNASRGWVSAAVEYRIGDRHGTLPFESVKDAKSAIRWLRENAAQYKFDKNKIVASGNSAGGHIALCAVLVDDYNEKTDNLSVSPKPDLLMINSGVYDLTIGNEWISVGFNNPDSVKAISPFYLVKKITQPVLIIHGTDDNNVPYWTAEKFAKAMQALSNPIEFKPMQGSGHFLWYDPKFSGEADRIRGAFLEANGIK